MRVLQLLYSGLGGHGSVAFSLLAGDKDGAWDPVLLFVGVEPVEEQYQEKCRALGIPFAYIASRRRRPWLAWPAIYAAIKRASPEAIIVHSVRSVLPCHWYASRHQIPLLAVEHTPVHVKTRFERLASRTAMVLADRIVVLTPLYKREHASDIGRFFRDNKVALVPNGIDIDHFAPSSQRQKTSSPKIRFGMAARYSGQKRQAFLVDVLEWLRVHAADREWQLSLAGDGERIAEVRREVARRGLTEHVEFCGSLDETDLATWFQSLDVYAHASDGETLSMSLLQAMAAGVPILASDVPGISNLLNGDFGIIGTLAPNHPEEFARQLQRLAAPQAGRELVRRASDVVRREYSVEAMFDGYRRAITECSRTD